ncbi:MAG TPA: hypothetical protein VF595_06925 [Tepidisphaeraceae bacterium]
MSAKPSRGPAPAQILCPNLSCRKLLAVPPEVRGQVVRCQHCQCLLRVPPAMPAATPAPSPA